MLNCFSPGLNFLGHPALCYIRCSALPGTSRGSIAMAQQSLSYWIFPFSDPLSAFSLQIAVASKRSGGLEYHMTLCFSDAQGPVTLSALCDSWQFLFQPHIRKASRSRVVTIGSLTCWTAKRPSYVGGDFCSWSEYQSAVNPHGFAPLLCILCHEKT